MICLLGVWKSQARPSANSSMTQLQERETAGKTARRDSGFLAVLFWRTGWGHSQGLAQASAVPLLALVLPWWVPHTYRKDSFKSPSLISAALHCFLQGTQLDTPVKLPSVYWSSILTYLPLPLVYEVYFSPLKTLVPLQFHSDQPLWRKLFSTSPSPEGKTRALGKDACCPASRARTLFWRAQCPQKAVSTQRMSSCQETHYLLPVSLLLVWLSWEDVRSQNLKSESKSTDGSRFVRRGQPCRWEGAPLSHSLNSQGHDTTYTTASGQVDDLFTVFAKTSSKSLLRRYALPLGISHQTQQTRSMRAGCLSGWRDKAAKAFSKLNCDANGFVHST